MSIIRFEDVDVIFSKDPREALKLLDQGMTRNEILKKTGQIVGVEKATLDINKGEICVLMGLSGSGKSSLLRCINGLNTVSRGKLFVEHENRQIDIASCTPAELKMMRTKRIAMVFQKFALMPWLTVRENISFGLEMQGRPEKERRKLVDEKLELVGLTQWRNKKPDELSGGMQQRVGLARALAMDADILLMDEPFSALDPLIRQGLQDELLELQRKLSKTIVFVSHDLDEALKTLSETERVCVSLCHGAGMSHPEIAAAMNLPLGTVKSHVKRGLDKLRARLSPAQGDGRSVHVG